MSRDKRKLDKILVVDLESTCWEGEPPPGEVQEKVEVVTMTVEVRR
jgi:inhibitor of KinA sporulation pathway (predicted exonuclease)